MKQINMLKSDTLAPRVTFPFAKSSEWVTRADKREWGDRGRGERKLFG